MGYISSDNEIRIQSIFFSGLIDNHIIITGIPIVTMKHLDSKLHWSSKTLKLVVTQGVEASVEGEGKLSVSISGWRYRHCSCIILTEARVELSEPPRRSEQSRRSTGPAHQHTGAGESAGSKCYRVTCSFSLHSHLS